MPSNISRAVLDALWPKGAIWDPKIDDGLDLFLDGNAENKEIVKLAIDALATIQIAELTQYLDDVEKEYGLVFDSSLSETERRAKLKNAIVNNQGVGTAWDMQAKLREAGFSNIFVYQNDPPVDVNDFVNIASAFECGDTTVECGSPTIEFAFFGGELVVVGDIFFGGLPVEHTVPLNDSYWANFFFVGGQATFSDVTEPLHWCGKTESEFGKDDVECGSSQTLSEISSILLADVPGDRRNELRRLIVKYKPIHAWGILLANFV